MNMLQIRRFFRPVVRSNRGITTLETLLGLAAAFALGTAAWAALRTGANTASNKVKTEIGTIGDVN